uniref:Uncharacterized protein n=1 Tax=Providencia stuartii TaxID=588 RepID=A0AAI9DG14_PROST|nr:hypothetical protein [Providencia stuartii]ELR5083251.1 hypothetical protein [Providencia stuartii]ELR5114952.1 hypothetical protein [Providencia stuartii]
MSTSQQIIEAIFQASRAEKKKAEKSIKEESQLTKSAGTEAAVAEEELEAFSSNNDSTHEEMQRLRMNAMQAEIDKLQAEVETMHTTSKGNEIDNSLRKYMAWMTFGFMVFWCLFVACVLGVYMFTKKGQLEPEVVIALLGTSTISIVGLVGFVVSGLFKSSTRN